MDVIALVEHDHAWPQERWLATEPPHGMLGVEEGRTAAVDFSGARDGDVPGELGGDKALAASFGIAAVKAGVP